MHKKRLHPEVCKPCDQFVSGDCARGNECWNTHPNLNDGQGFQKDSQQEGPP